ncbi:MAG: hypothetical protein K8W52_34475 [Deltaproteobacteria bacterium]|nr:hypothetical protein [Deltaproteobacteria bacterium]
MSAPEAGRGAWSGALGGIAALVLAACTRAAEPAPPLHNSAPPPGAAIDAPLPDAADSACVRDCVQARQMEATSIANIRASCARECAGRQ